MTSRLFRTSERGLATLRIKAFRHVHDLPLLTQNTERRGALVSRVTSDVDQVSQFLVFGGLIFIVSIGQMLVATVVMVFYSWQLALVVWVCFAPLFLSIRYFQRKLSEAYGVVRRQVGVLLSAISEPVVGAAVVRSYAVEDRTQERIDAAIDEFKARQHPGPAVHGRLVLPRRHLGRPRQRRACSIVGVLLGFAGDITAGKVLAFAFLVTLFVGPVQMGTQILTDAQNAIAGWRRVIGILETPADLVDPGPDGRGAAARADRRRLRRRRPSPTPAARRCCATSTSTIDAGTRRRDRRRDRLGQVDLRQAAHPADGPRPRAGCCSTASTSATIAAGSRCAAASCWCRRRASSSTTRSPPTSATASSTPPTSEILASADELGLADWLAGLPHGLETEVGQRGESLSAGERQLVALLRAHLADPDLLVLDEATSAVDPQLEMRIGRALERLMTGRTVGHHRPPALHRRERRRGGRRRPGPDRPARPARRAGRPGRLGLRRAARLLGGPAGRSLTRGWDTGGT